MGVIERIVALLLMGVLALTGTPMPPGTAAEPPDAARPVAAGIQEEFRAVWVATVYRLDYPSEATADPQILRQEADAILQDCADMGMNAVILQVRPCADAFYPSEIFPWSRYLTGRQGSAPRDGFDPLAYWVERAHALGLELHAWINPFRITKAGAADQAELAAHHPAVLHPEWVVEYEDNLYFDPGLPEVQALILQGAEELVRNYDIDGIHLDDYFYPGSGFDDGETYARYGQGFSSLGDWRRDNVNRLVKALGERVHALDPAISYGISPSGVWADRSSLPGGSDTTGGYESYYAAYADSRKWVQEGWIDYICPQIYWYIGHKSMDYAAIARWWADTVEGTGVRLYIGMADYQAGNSDPASPWHGTQAIEAQLALNDTLPQVAGEVHFRYRLIAGEPALRALYQRVYAPSRPAPPSRPFLNRAEHTAYVEGQDGKFRPDAVLSRAEAVTLLARLSVDGEGEPLAGLRRAPFADVAAGDWYAEGVDFAWTYGVANGYPDGTFRPGDPVSRAELVKLLAAYGPPAGETTAAPFPDVPSGHWAAGAIAYAQAEGWVDGYADGTFQPQRPVTRGEAVKLLNAALGRSMDETARVPAPFSDVPEDHWAYGDILEAAVSHAFYLEEGRERWRLPASGRNASAAP